MKDVKEIISYLKEKGFVYPGSDIYGGLANSWDYGPLGAILKDRIVSLWKKVFIKQDINTVYNMDSSIMLNNKVWEVSGHSEKFNDPMIINKTTKTRYRADHLLEKINVNPVGKSFEELTKIIKENIIRDPNSGEAVEWTDVRPFELMFKTTNSKTGEDGSDIFLRPETAQGIFINFKNVVDTVNAKIPFGIAQYGKAFRNEVTPGNFIFRTKEFEQLELEMFVHPEKADENFTYYLEKIDLFLLELGIDKEKYHRYETPKQDLAHYSSRTVDIEFDFSFGRGELLGLTNRTDYDLKAHGINYRDPKTNEKFIPFVIEPSMGLGRLFFAVIASSLTTEQLDDGEREVLRIPFDMAPYRAAVAPLTNKIDDEARKVYNELVTQTNEYITYSQGGSIGKRYRKQDSIGTPYVITIDFDTAEDKKVTIRNRDTMEQERISITNITKYISK